MVGIVSPKTCQASYKYGITKLLIHCFILLVYLYELNYEVIMKFGISAVLRVHTMISDYGTM